MALALEAESCGLKGVGTQERTVQTTGVAGASCNRVTRFPRGNSAPATQPPGCAVPRCRRIIRHSLRLCESLQGEEVHAKARRTETRLCANSLVFVARAKAQSGPLKCVAGSSPRTAACRWCR